MFVCLAGLPPHIMKNHPNMVWTEMIFRMEYPQMKCLLVQFIQPRNADGVYLFQKFCFIWFICFWVLRGFFPSECERIHWFPSQWSIMHTCDIQKTLSQKVITYHWDQATIGNGSLFSHKNTQHTALATVTLDCIVLQSIFLAGGICAQKQIYKIPKVGFPKLPKRISINFYDRF